MKPQYVNGQVRAHCPDCGGTITTFESRDGNRELGSTLIAGVHAYQGTQFTRIVYAFLRCASCHRGGIAKVHDSGTVAAGVLEEFYPLSIDRASIPGCVPEGISKEFREAENCAAFRAWRAASALLRSTLEKTLKANGYLTGSLQHKIDEAAADGVITDARRRRAHDDIRVLGNDVLHDEWREVTDAEVVAAQQYTQRLLEDFYDDRPSVEGILIAKNRTQA